MGTESIEASFLSIFALISFFIFLLVSKYSHRFKGGALLDKDFSNPKLFMTYLFPEAGASFNYFIKYFFLYLLLTVCRGFI